MKFTTGHLAEFVRETRYEHLPEPTAEMAERAILDTIASLIGGVATQNATLTRLAAKASFGSGPAAAWFTDTRLHPLGGVLANCAAASALDIDDGHCLAAGHPGAAIIPAVLTEAAVRQSDGHDVLTAVAVGYDVALRIAAARQFTDTMSFASGQWTGYGIAAALGWLRGLPPDQVAHAMAIAGAEAPQNLPQGECRASSVKGSSPWSTVSAFVAVDRASCGLTGSIDLLDRAHAYDVSAITADLGRRWLITETYLKPYAACRYTHPVIDAVLGLVAAHGGGKAVDRIAVEIFPEARKLPNDRAPFSLESAQFSIPFAAALAAVRGREAFRPLLPQVLTDADVLALAKKVDVQYPEKFVGAFPGRTPARVRLNWIGNEAQTTVPLPLGDPKNPMDRDAVEEKLHDLGRQNLSSAERDEIIESIALLRRGRSAPLLACLGAYGSRANAVRAQSV